MTIQQALRQAASALQQASVPDANTDAAWLLADATGLPRMELPLHGGQALTPQQEQRFSSLLLSRCSRRPLQYLLGVQHFYGLPFAVDARVLIPRPETETLCELALAFVKTLPNPQVLDLCTGSGCIAVAIRRQCPAARVTAADISAQALALARQNADANDCDDIRFLQGDLLAAVAGEAFDCIVCNPPYIQSEACKTLQPEVLFEPVLALDGGADGLAFYRRIAGEAASHLRPGGLMALEIGDAQGEAVCGLLVACGWETITLHRDLGGLTRVVTACGSTPT